MNNPETKVIINEVAKQKEVVYKGQKDNNFSDALKDSGIGGSQWVKATINALWGSSASVRMLVYIDVASALKRNAFGSRLSATSLFLRSYKLLKYVGNVLATFCIWWGTQIPNRGSLEHGGDVGAGWCVPYIWKSTGDGCGKVMEGHMGWPIKVIPYWHVTK
eukprot:4709969-Ditylum_brightwellii.AAC.1